MQRTQAAGLPSDCDADHGLDRRKANGRSQVKPARKLARRLF